MKKILAFAIFALLGTGAYAQTSQGTVVVSGGAGFSTSTSDNQNDQRKPRRTSFSLSPGVGYMFQDGLEMGVQLSYSHSEQKNHIYYDYNGMPEYNYTSTLSTNTFAISPYLKKYFPLTDNLFLTGAASVSVGISKSNYSASNDDDWNSSNENKGNTFGVGLSPGITFFPTEKIGLSATFGNLGYNRSTTEYDGRERSASDFGFYLNSSTSMISFGYYISR